MKTLRPNSLWWLGILVFSAPASPAAVIPTSSFTAIPDAVFINVSGYELFRPYTSDSITITPDPLLYGGSGTFSEYIPPGTPEEPGDGYGVLASYRAPNPVGNLTLNFSAPVAAFGVTFFHLDATTLRRWGLHLPGLVLAYDGPNATGNLLGSVTSSGWFPTALGYNFDFVGVMSDSANIQSVVIGGSVEPKGYGVDGYAFSFTPIPEPGAATLLGLGLIVLARAKRNAIRL